MRRPTFRNDLSGTAAAGEPLGARARAMARPLLVFALVGLLITGSVYAFHRLEAAQILEHAAAELRAAAHLLGTQYSAWYEDRVRNMRQVGRGPFTMRSLAEWQVNRPPQVEDLLRDRLEAVRSNHDFSGVAALAPDGTTLIAVGQPIDADAALRNTIRVAIESDDVAVRFVPAVDHHGAPVPSIDFVVVLRDRLAVDGPQPPVAAVVARGPVPHLAQPASAALGRLAPEVVLVRHDGPGFGVIDWSAGDGAGRYLVLPDGSDLYTVDSHPGGPGEVRAARDHQGREVLAFGSPVLGTGWTAVAVVDRSRVDAQIRDMTLRIASAGVLGFIGAGLLLLPWWRSMRVRAVARVQAAESRADEMATRLGWVTRQANDAILLIGERGKILDANDHAVQCYGYSRAELLTLTIFQLRSSDVTQQADAQAQFEEVWRGEARVFEAVHGRKDGSTFPVEVSSRRVEFRGQRYVQSIVRDISKRRRAELRLRDSEAQYRLLFRANPHPMWVYDLQTLRFLAVNDAAVGHYGYAEDEFLAMTIAEIRPEEERARLLADVRAHAEDTMQRSGTWLHSRKDGSVIEVEIISHRIEFDGRAARLVLAHDVTDRLRVERALRASEERYRGLFENASDGIVLIGRDQRILAANTEFQSMLGYSGQELETVGLAALLDPGERPRFERQFAGISDGQWPAPANWLHRRKDGSAVTAEVRVRPLPGGDILATVRDLTELLLARRHAERQRDLYALLSQCNEAIARATDREDLIKSVTRLAVERGRFRFAWMGEIDDAWRVIPVTQAGDDAGYVAGLNLSVDADSPAGAGPTAQALRSGQPVVVNDFLADPRTAPWHEPGRSIGIRASAAFPIRCAGRVALALMLYANEVDFFAPDIVATLEQMTNDVSHALDALQTRRELEDQRLLLESIIDAADSFIYAADLEGRIILLNAACARSMGVKRQRVLGCERAEIMPLEMARDHAANDRRVIQTGRTLVVEERTSVAGTERVYLSIKYPLKDIDGRMYAVGGISTDITDLRRMPSRTGASSRRSPSGRARRRKHVNARRLRTVPRACS